MKINNKKRIITISIIAIILFIANTLLIIKNNVRAEEKGETITHTVIGRDDIDVKDSIEEISVQNTLTNEKIILGDIEETAIEKEIYKIETKRYKATKQTNTSKDDLPKRENIEENFEVSNPEIDNPEIDNPEVDNPEIDNPEVDNPEIDNPEVDNPEIDNPEVDNPEVDNPEIDNPEVDNPEVDNPEVDNPEIDNPEVDNPEVDNPEIDNPEVDNSEESKKEEDEENYTIIEDGIIINTSPKIKEIKLYNGIQISNIKITYKGNTSILTADATNITNEKIQGFLARIILVDKMQKEITTISTYINFLEPNQTKNLYTSASYNFVNAYDVKFN